MRSHAWISGGGGALGGAFARALLDRGAAGVTLADADAAAGAAARDALRAARPRALLRFDHVDVTDAAAVRASLEAAAAAAAAAGGRLGLVVNNAGTADEADVAGHFRLNAVAVVEATRSALTVLRQCCSDEEPGCVVNVASAAGVFPLNGAPVYTASKHAVVGFTRCFAFHGGAPEYVKVCALAPGFTRSPMLDRTFRTAAEKRRLLDSVGVMDPSEVASALLHVVTEPEVASGSCLYVSASTGSFDPFAKQLELWKEAVRAHRRGAGARRARL